MITKPEGVLKTIPRATSGLQEAGSKVVVGGKAEKIVRTGERPPPWYRACSATMTYDTLCRSTSTSPVPTLRARSLEAPCLSHGAECTCLRLVRKSGSRNNRGGCFALCCDVMCRTLDQNRSNTSHLVVCLEIRVSAADNSFSTIDTRAAT